MPKFMAVHTLKTPTARDEIVSTGKSVKAYHTPAISLSCEVQQRTNEKETPMTGKFIKIALFSGALMALAPGVVLADPIPKKGTTPYVTHFIFRPVLSIDVPGLGTATALEAVGTTENMKGEKMLDKMSARCAALSVASGDKKYIDGACVLVDSDGDKIMSTFDTRDVDKSQPDRGCGTHIITGGTGKYAGITGREPFACIALPPLAGGGGYTAMDIPHNTTWEIK